MSIKPTISAEVKPDVEKKRNDDTDGEQIPINVDPVSKDTEKIDNARDDDKDGVSGPDISNYEKELEQAGAELSQAQPELGLHVGVSH